MRIDKLELFGFKSFPDRTVFEFGSGISCVVGPNGSGKSNVVDALRWCIGEQSARSLRGSEMSDVIFAGSAARAPVGFAEVTLTLAAEGEPFPGDFARFEAIEVGRRLYRDGTSEYLLNRVKCRRRDIVELFLDTGVGANLYSFIAQGQVDRIVSQSANDRRVLIDEAAGITRYKARREEAMGRLVATGAQLDRAADVSDEMGRRLRTLERQVLRAGRFRRARARIRQREIALGVVKYGALSDDRRALRQTLRTVRDDAGALSRSVDRLANELETRTAELKSVREALRTWRAESAELEAQRREAEGAARLQTERFEELKATGARASERLERARHELDTATAEVAAVDAALKTLEATGATEALETARSRHDQAREASSAARRTLEASRQAEARRIERVGALEDERRRLQTRLAGLQAVPVAENADELDLEGARAAVTTARTELDAFDEVATRRRDAHDRAMRAWEKAREAREQREVELRRWVVRTRRALRIARDQAHRRVVAQAEERAARWIDVLRSTQTRALERAEAAHTAALEAERTAHAAERAASHRAVAEQLERVDSDTSSEPAREVVQATEAVRAARSALEAAEHASRTASDEASTAAGALKALQAEFAELDARRSASIPDAWADREVFVDHAAEDDPRHVARAGIGALPIVDRTALLEAIAAQSTGRGVWAAGSGAWVVVDTPEALIDVLESQGPPVTTRDGTVRVDADGVVTLGAPVAPEARWAEVRDALIGARARAEASRVEAEKLRSKAGEAREALDAAVRRRAAADEALERHRAQRRETIRTAADEAEGARLAEQEASERVLREAHQQRMARTRRQHAEALEAAVVAGRAAVAQLRPGPAYTFAVLGAGGLAWPEPVPPRPAAPSESDPGERGALKDAVRQAEARLEQQTTAARERAERQAAERARREEITRIQARLDELEAALEASEPDPELPAIEAAADLAERTVLEAAAVLQEAERTAAARRERRAAEAARRERATQTLARARGVVDDSEAEIRRVQQGSEAALTAAEEARATGERLAVQRAEVEARVAREKARLDGLAEEHDRVRTALEDARDRSVRATTEQGELEQRVQSLQLEIEALRKRLGDRYQVSLPGLLDRLHMRKRLVLDAPEAVQEALTIRDVVLEAVDPLSIGPSFAEDVQGITTMVQEVEALRETLAGLGEVNLAAEEEYVDLAERHAELLAQTEDLEQSVKSIRAAIAKMNRTCRERFRDAYDRVNEAFQSAYPRLVGGGDARLALTDEEDLLETGVDIFVRPPGKRLQNLTLLSGGEKAMTAIALLLALFEVKPSPFCVLDEVDAPLDEANGARFNDMLREMSRMSQFIVITHNRKTMECADVLYGVTMARPGVSTLVSVALETEA